LLSSRLYVSRLSLKDNMFRFLVRHGQKAISVGRDRDAYIENIELSSNAICNSALDLRLPTGDGEYDAMFDSRI
jgi:hypothetical protein